MATANILFNLSALCDSLARNLAITIIQQQQQHTRSTRGEPNDERLFVYIVGFFVVWLVGAKSHLSESERGITYIYIYHFAYHRRVAFSIRV